MLISKEIKYGTYSYINIFIFLHVPTRNFTHVKLLQKRVSGHGRLNIYICIYNHYDSNHLLIN